MVRRMRNEGKDTGSYWSVFVSHFLGQFSRKPQSVLLAPLPQSKGLYGFCVSFQALRSPSKHLEQAKAIVDGNSELLNSEFASFLASEKINEDVVAAKVNENARERRPGLGRRRARFSLKLDSRYHYCGDA